MKEEERAFGLELDINGEDGRTQGQERRARIKVMRDKVRAMAKTLLTQLAQSKTKEEQLCPICFENKIAIGLNGIEEEGAEATNIIRGN